VVDERMLELGLSPPVPKPFGAEKEVKVLTRDGAEAKCQKRILEARTVKKELASWDLEKSLFIDGIGKR